ncbi:MAG: VapC toxin family PIN domain ribonuclease [Methylophaga sp.]|nr:MAG: VapC toxin family PIN domain ribonuclease [Methylophaga sp.]
MIVLDTNVLSELMRLQPSKSVISWLDNQAASKLYITAITVAEILYGIARLAEGKRKSALFTAASDMFDQDFGGRILAFDSQAAVLYADLVSNCESSGRQVSMADAQIAAICQLHEANIATRNIKDFEPFNLNVINPWQ